MASATIDVYKYYDEGAWSVAPASDNTGSGVYRYVSGTTGWYNSNYTDRKSRVVWKVTVTPDAGKKVTSLQVTAGFFRAYGYGVATGGNRDFCGWLCTSDPTNSSEKPSNAVLCEEAGSYIVTQQGYAHKTFTFNNLSLTAGTYYIWWQCRDDKACTQICFRNGSTPSTATIASQETMRYTLTLVKGSGVASFTGGGTYDYGTQATTVAKASAGYHLTQYSGTMFDGSGNDTWLDCSGKTEDTEEWTMNANRTITVSAEANTLIFKDESKTTSYSTSAQTMTVGTASNGTGNYTYSMATNNNFTFNATTRVLTLKANASVSTYTAKVTATDSVSKASTTKTITWVVSRANSATVSATNKTYDNGSELIGVSGSYITLTGTYKETKVGNYSATATPDSNHAWSDGTFGAVTKTWSIIKANSAISVTSTQTGTMTYATTTQNATFSGATGGVGAITYAITAQKKDNTNVSYFTIPKASTPSIRAAANTPHGRYVITINATSAGDDNYNASTKEITYTITVNKANADFNINVISESEIIFKGDNIDITTTSKATPGDFYIGYRIDGSSQTIWLPENTNFILTKSPKPMAGTYQMYYRFTPTDTNNYNSIPETAIGNPLIIWVQLNNGCIKINYNREWKTGRLYIKQNGKWEKIALYIKRNGIWEELFKN